jgi:hypothetical protein
LAKASDEASEDTFVGGVRFVRTFSGHGGLAGEDELRDVSKSDGVAAVDALASELPDEIAEEEIDLIGGSETVDVGKKFGGEDLGIDNGNADSETLGVVGAEGRALRTVRGAMVLVDQHVTAVALRANVLAVGIDGGANGSAEFGRHGCAFLKIEVTT